MPDHDTTAVLAHQLGRLDTDACAALVADLWSARGYETSRDGGRVVATRNGTTLRIRVGTPEDPADPPDLIVSPRGTRGGRAAARAADARFADADALVDRDGLVRDLTVTYTVVAGTERYRVRTEWTYGNLGETAVRPPAWYGERFSRNVTTPVRTAD